MVTTKKLAVAILVAAAMIGIVPMPTQAVDPDCSSEFTIPEAEPGLPSTLLANSEITGSIVIGSQDDKDVHVELSSSDSTMSFGVFVVDSGCVAAKDSMAITCTADETLVTNTTQVKKICALEPDSSTSVTYYFHLVNEQSSFIQYRIWEVEASV